MEITPFAFHSMFDSKPKSIVVKQKNIGSYSYNPFKTNFNVIIIIGITSSIK